MDMVCPDDGKARFLELAFGASTPMAFNVVRLYQNNYTPDDSSNASNFTESTFPGYAAWTLNPADWQPANTVAHVGEIETYTPPTFSCSGGGGELAYGWYLQDSATSRVLLAQRFDTPRNMVAGANEVLDPFRVKCKTFV